MMKIDVNERAPCHATNNQKLFKARELKKRHTQRRVCGVKSKGRRKKKQRKLKHKDFNEYYEIFMFVCIIYTIKTIRKVNETEKVSHFVDMLVKKITMNDDLFTACYSHFQIHSFFFFPSFSSRLLLMLLLSWYSRQFFFLSLRAYAFGTH